MEFCFETKIGCAVARLTTHSEKNIFEQFTTYHDLKENGV